MKVNVIYSPDDNLNHMTDGCLTDERAESSYGSPVLIDEKSGEVVDTFDPWSVIIKGGRPIWGMARAPRNNAEFFSHAAVVLLSHSVTNSLVEANA